MALLAGDHALLVEVALPVCARYGLGIAGGYAMKAHGLVDRPSEDIDFATSHPAPVEEITEALAADYRSSARPTW
jgi:Nucleotidyl transferase AbiEii toxin, Type IV TA system